MVSGARITFVGEAMLELSARPDGSWSMGYGGDTLNTAIHMARMGCNVAFASALGSDALSADLRSDWEAESLDCALLLSDTARSTGLYAISLDDAGERSFSYWRSDSAARQMFSLPGSAEMVARAAQSDVLAFSLISLAILPPEGREALFALARTVRERGGTVAFDGNYRPRLWESAEAAQAARDAAIAVATIGLPTLEDEAALSDTASAEDVASHWQSLGCDEVVVKLGASGCRLPDGSVIAPDRTLTPVDTSGAGDAFNAGYLAARMAEAPPSEAARKGHAIAGWTIMRPGAIPARDEAAPYA
ncbi:MAG: sugar kinase [Sphingomonadaceae bacterium]